MPTPPPEVSFEPPPSALRRALLRFLAAGAATLVVVVLVSGVVAYQVSRDVAVRQAQIRGVSFAAAVSAPLVNRDLRNGDPQELAQFGEVMHNRLQDESIVHIKVWDEDGRVIWADQEGQRDRVFRLQPEVQRLFGTDEAVASMSSLDNADGHSDSPGPLLEVYAGATDADGQPVVVESYWAPEAVNADVRAIMVRIAALPIAGLLLFVLVLLPLAWSLARRVDRAQAASNKSLQHALSAADLERRRIARDLHDGVMQDVSAAGYALSAVSPALPADAEAPRRLVAEVSALVRQVGEALRSLVADIYPPNLARDGLSIAVEDLADRAADQGVAVHVDIPVDASRELPLAAAQLCYRVIREALRNVLRHAQASNAEVRAVIGENEVWVSVADDGVGLPETVKDQGGSHFGLRLLEDTLVDVGGTLVLEPGARGGTVLSATVPFNVEFR